MNDYEFLSELKEYDNGNLWKAIKMYKSDHISIGALIRFTDVIMDYSNYNIPKLLELWDRYHEYANK